MELTNKEKIYLELYKGDIKDKKNLCSETGIEPSLLPEIDYSYRQLNLFLTFLFEPSDELLKLINRPKIDGLMDIAITLSDIACRYAMEHPLNRRLYRLENINNLDNYGKDGMTLSFKSTSKSSSEATAFNYPDNFGVSFNTEGFIPYIDVDNLVSSDHFSDEKEILFPPYLNSEYTDFEEKILGVNYKNVILKDNYDDELSHDYTSLYEKAKVLFLKEFYKSKEQGEVSSDLKTYCSILGECLYSKIRNIYKNYALFYKETFGENRGRN